MAEDKFTIRERIGCEIGQHHTPQGAIWCWPFCLSASSDELATDIGSVSLSYDQKHNLRRQKIIMMTTDTQALRSSLAQALQDFWESYVGVRPTDVLVVSNQDAIAIWLADILSPAEHQMVSAETGRLAFREFGERMLECAKPQLQHLVEDIVGRKVNLVEVHLDLKSESFFGFFLTRPKQDASGANDSELTMRL